MPLVIKKPSITGRRMKSLGDLVSPYTILHNLEGSQDEVEVVNNNKTATGSWESMPSLSHKTRHILKEEERLTKMLAHITAECSHFDEMGKGIDHGSVDSAVVVVPSNGETSQHLNIEFLQKRAASPSSSSCSTTESMECSSQHTTMTREQQAHHVHGGPAKDEKTSNRHCRWSLPTPVSASRKRLQEASRSQRSSRPLSCGNLSRTVSASCRRLASSQRLSRPLSHGNNILSRIATETSYKRLREAPNQRVSRPLSHYGYSKTSSYYCPMG